MDAPISRKIHIDMEVSPTRLIMERPHDRDAGQADVPEGGRLTATCIASGSKPPAYIYWNSEPHLDMVSSKLKPVISVS